MEMLELDRPLLPKYVPGEESADHFSRILGQTPSLAVLSLKYHNIGDTGARLFGQTLNKADMLTTLNLECNKIGIAGGEALASYLIAQARAREGVLKRQNAMTAYAGQDASELTLPGGGLRHLLLSHNFVGDQGAVAIGEALKVNSSLETLTLKNNRIGAQGLQAIGEAIAVNNTLQQLNLFGNDFDHATATQYDDLIRTRLPFVGMALDVKTYVVDGVCCVAEQQ